MIRFLFTNKKTDQVNKSVKTVLNSGWNLFWKGAFLLPVRTL
ncbi:hypothetical protein ATPR_2229 [Acetobacter tropicalis NBRC 101654]|uniref:Uncharacterized protein n=1 Tax=Acetobacter tropicalis NBRC 101654 TaxID=749388 RepID=F7VFT0_9PROT|nr:hypothetical protein ATPR_2229 [Acetobacter tropicalis NBRC 101654]